MMAVVKQHLSSAMAVLFGFSIAVVFAPLVLATADWYKRWNAENNPVATLEWHSIERIDADVLRLQLRVTRHDDCLMVRALGYTGASFGAMRPAESFGRADARPPQDYPVGISVISYPWLLRGIHGDKLAVSIYYDCENRVVKAPLLTGGVPKFTPPDPVN